MNKKYYIWCLMTFVLLGFVSAQNTNNLLLQAKVYSEQGKISESQKILQSINKKSVALFNQMAENYVLLGDYKQAVFFYLKADSLNDLQAKYKISKCYALLNNPENSVNWLKKYLKQKSKLSEAAIQKEPAFAKNSNSPIWNELWKTEWYSPSEIEINAVQSLIANKQISEALTRLDNARNVIFPRDAFFYLESQVYYHLNQFTNALDDINQAITLNSRNENYFNLKSKILLATDRKTEAFGTLTKVIDLNPLEAEGYLQRGTIAIEIGNIETAKEDLVLYNNLYPAKPEGIYQLAKLHTSTGNFQDALHNYTSLVAIDSGQVKYYNDYASLAITLKQYNLAEETINKSLDIDPFLSGTNLLKGKIRLYFQDTENACLYLKKALKNADAQKLYLQYCN